MLYETLDKSIKFKLQFYYPKNVGELLLFLKNNKKTISSGSGLTFASNFLDSEAKLISHKNLNKILSFDKTEGVIEMESGCELGEVQKFLIDHNFILKIQPGWSRATVSGCIANSIHGKNPFKDGTFENIIDEINLILPGDYKITKLTKILNSEIFYNTIGGYGLTGTIVSAKLKLDKVDSLFFSEESIEINSFEQSIKNQMINDKLISSYSWHDMTLRKNKIGRGVLFRYCELSELNLDVKKLSYKKPIDLKKFNQPINFFNKYSIELANIYYRFSKLRRKAKKIDIYKYLYPMEVFPGPFWFFMNGRTGFIEHEILIPLNDYEKYFYDLKKNFQQKKINTYGCFIKLFNGKKKNLVFDGKGVAISIEFLNTKKNLEFLDEMDKFNLQYGAITALYKDSRISRDTVINQYGEEYFKFVNFIKKLDPHNVIMSNFKRKFIL
jgi:decaprenylphospho-beta-D-ribofuranose 2-oxidase